MSCEGINDILHTSSEIIKTVTAYLHSKAVFRLSVSVRVYAFCHKSKEMFHSTTPGKMSSSSHHSRINRLLICAC